jgi:hypothetical protein
VRIKRARPEATTLSTVVEPEQKALRKRSTVVITGALAGGLLAVCLLALFLGRFATEFGLSEGGDALLALRAGAVYLASVIAALIGGAAVATVSYGVSARDDDALFQLTHIMPFGLLTAVAASYSVLRAGLGIAADVAAGTIEVTAAALTFSSLAAGVVAGGATAWVVATLATKSIVGLEGEAAPASTAAMMRAATQAVLGPILAIVVIAVLAIGLAQLLLAAEGTAAIVIFAAVGALVLFGAAAAAYFGGDGRTAE